MKKSYLLFIILFLVNNACQKSQFPSTTRQVKNGKVTYTNYYRAERIKYAKGKSPKNQKTTPAAQIPSTDALSLIASVSNEPVLFSLKGPDFVLLNELKFSAQQNDGLNFHQLLPDSIKNDKPKETRSGNQVVSDVKIIKFKNGQTKAANIISQSNDTLMYRIITEPDVVRGVMMEQVDSILPDQRKTEPLAVIGFTSSLLGLVPIFGIPFAITGLILGTRSLRKIRKYPVQYKGIGLAKASLVLGVIGVALSIVFLIIGIASSANSCHSSGMHF